MQNQGLFLNRYWQVGIGTLGIGTLAVLLVGQVNGALATSVVREPSDQFINPQLIAQDTVLTRAYIYSLVGGAELQPSDASARDAVLDDLLIPLDALSTYSNSRADLQFNEGSISRVGASSSFYFRQGLRRYQLANRIASGTVLVLEDGIAAVIVPPNGTVTEVETPQGRIQISAESTTAQVGSPLVAMGKATGEQSIRTTTGAIANPLPRLIAQASNQPATDEPLEPPIAPPERSSVVVISHDAKTGKTQVFALTDGNVSVSDLNDKKTVALIGGQTVAVANGQVGSVQEFDLGEFYRTMPIVAGLGEGQEGLIEPEPEAAQTTLNLARVETLAAIRRQARQQVGFNSSFLRDALGGADAGRTFDGRRGRGNEITIGGTQLEGTFQRSGNDNPDSDLVTGTFTPDNDPNRPVRIRANLETRTIQINGRNGRSNTSGLSGNSAAGTVNLDNGGVVRIEVFDVGNEAPRPGERYRGRLRINAIAPDR
jgi:hypothetical protein